jgi:hypothetical protein
VGALARSQFAAVGHKACCKAGRMFSILAKIICEAHTAQANATCCTMDTDTNVS